MVATVFYMYGVVFEHDKVLKMTSRIKMLVQESSIQRYMKYCNTIYVFYRVKYVAIYTVPNSR